MWSSIEARRRPQKNTSLKTKKIVRNLRNRVQLIGNLGRDPQLFELAGGKVKASVSLATNDTYVDDKGEKIKDTQWHKLVAWGSTAKFLSNYCHKGTEIAVEGRLTYNEYTDKDGIQRNNAEVVVREILMLNRKQNGAPSPESHSAVKSATGKAQATAST